MVYTPDFDIPAHGRGVCTARFCVDHVIFVVVGRCLGAGVLVGGVAEQSCAAVDAAARALSRVGRGAVRIVADRHIDTLAIGGIAVFPGRTFGGAAHACLGVDTGDVRVAAEGCIETLAIATVLPGRTFGGAARAYIGIDTGAVRIATEGRIETLVIAAVLSRNALVRGTCTHFTVGHQPGCITWLERTHCVRPTCRVIQTSECTNFTISAFDTTNGVGFWTRIIRSPIVKGHSVRFTPIFVNLQ